MKLQRSACIDTLYTELPFLDRFAAAQKDGFDLVEFWDRRERELPRVKAAAEAAGIGICGFNGDGEFSLIAPAEREAYLSDLRRSLDAAAYLRARSLTIHSNALGPGGMVMNTYPELSHTVKLCAMFDTLQACARLGEEYGILLNLEALNTVTDHAGNFLTSTQTAAEMTALIGSPYLRILFDAYHMYLNGEELQCSITRYAGQFGHVHLADAPGRHEPGTGELRFARICEALEKNGYTGAVGYELFPRSTTAEAVKAIFAD